MTSGSGLGRASAVAMFALLVCLPSGGAAGAATVETRPPTLATVIGRDLGITPREYLRRSAAAQRLASFAAAAAQRFPGAVGPVRLDGAGRGIVTVAANAPQARAAVRAAGWLSADDPRPAAPDVPAPLENPVDHPVATAPDVETIAGGDIFATPNPQGTAAAKCSWAFNAVDADGQSVALTAGHCNLAVRQGLSPSDYPATYRVTAGRLAGAVAGAPTGRFEKSVLDGQRDYSIVHATDSARDAFGDNLVRGPVGDSDIAVTGVGIPVVGAPVCKSGATTGFTCGVVTAVDQPDPQRPPARFKHSALSLPGDSGGALISGTLALGIVSSGGFDTDLPSFPTEPPVELPSAPANPLFNLGKMLDQVGPQRLQQLGPPVAAVLPHAPFTMIAQSVADVLAENPGLRLRTS
ncbi:S1 family peptidase [Nocardia sp. NBC_00511]|uniref:S1 family peptidase n=1 Tax=Nocardia sp. NBC_00511 TaxID=2903591 RepID=UPI0030E3A408